PRRSHLRLAEGAMRPWLVLLAPVLAALTGCTPSTRWGDEARYASDFRGYVIAKPGPSPRFVGLPVQVGDTDATRRILLKDPITGEKIRCREQLDDGPGPVT